MSCVWMLQRGHSGDGCVLASTLCKYDLRKGDLFVLSWARVRRVRRGSISSELLVCGGGTLSWRSGKRPRLRARRVKVRFSLRAIILSLENLNVIIRAIN